MTENTTEDHSVELDNSRLRDSYPYRLGKALALLDALVNPPEWTDDEATERRTNLAREFLAEEAERDARTQGRLRTPFAGGDGR